MKILVINGPNLNILVIREPDHYGRETYADLVVKIQNHCANKGVKVKLYQSNHEGDPEENGYARVEFEVPQRAITPGQAVVLYNGEDVVGGGTITEVL